jgi:hypothetical protein
VSSKTCPNPAGPSVPCSGVDTTWYCAPGCTCDDSRDQGCNCFGGSCPDSGSGDSSSAAAPTSTPVVTSAGSAPTITAAAGGGSSTTASAAAAGTTAKASDGMLKVQTAWALAMGFLILEIFVVL